MAFMEALSLLDGDRPTERVRLLRFSGLDMRGLGVVPVEILKS